MSDEPKGWASLPEHEREALLEIARLPAERRKAMIRAGKNIEFWDTLSSKVTATKVAVIGIGAICAYATGLLDFLLSAFDGTGGAK